MEANFTVGEVARLAKVTVRTLHHYDAIGLLSPSGRSDSGYRLYGRADLERLQQIRLYRELGMSLDAIRAVLDDPDFDRVTALRRHREALLERIEDAERLVRTVDATLAAISEDTPMSMSDLFDGFDPDAHAPEAEVRWGDTPQFQQSQQRTKGYGPKQWAAIQAETQEINALFAAQLAAGLPPESTEAMDAAEAHRQHITRWFYTCSRAMHAQVAQMYTEDPRFEAHYEKVVPGLAAYVRAAVEANLARG